MMYNMMALILDTGTREHMRAHTLKPQPAAPESPVSRFCDASNVNARKAAYFPIEYKSQVHPTC